MSTIRFSLTWLYGFYLLSKLFIIEHMYSSAMFQCQQQYLELTSLWGNGAL